MDREYAGGTAMRRFPHTHPDNLRLMRYGKMIPLKAARPRNALEIAEGILYAAEGLPPIWAILDGFRTFKICTDSGWGPLPPDWQHWKIR